MPFDHTKKTLGTAERKEFKAEVVGFDDKEMWIDHFISTETPDSDGDIMKADGMKTRGNLVVLFHHGKDIVHGVEPIAKCLGLRQGVNVAGAKGWVARTKFFDGSSLTPPDNTGERLYQKCKEMYLPNWSVGFERKAQRPTAEGYMEVTDWLMFEYSLTPVGANEEATNITKEFKDYLPLRFEFQEEKPEVTETEKTGEKKLNNEEKTVTGAPKTPAVSLKTIAENVAYTLPSQAVETLYYAMRSEMINSCYSDGATKDMDCAKLASDLVGEFSQLCIPHVQKCMETIRDRRFSEKTCDTIEHKNFLLENIGRKEKVVADPAPATTPLEPESVKTQVALTLKSEDAPKAVTFADDVIKAIDSAKEAEPSIPISAEEVKSLIAEQGAETRKTVRSLFNRLTGKLDN